MAWRICAACAVMLCSMGCDDDPGETDGSGGAPSTTINGTGAIGSGAFTGAGGAGGGGSDIPGGGTILFEEHFDDANFMSRGWYDGPSGTISTAEAAPGSTSSFECNFQNGATSCDAGKPARHLFTDSETVYLAFWLKFSDNWVGSGMAYHPHMFHFISNLDDDYVGPANSFLTTYTEVVESRAMLALQDSRNVDGNCILRNDDSFVGCNGDFDSYMFTENRSVCACNGLAGYVDGRDCFDNGGYWYSARAWYADNAFSDSEWHRVEVYFAMNSIDGGTGTANGSIRWVQDGQTLIASDEILLRTGANATMAFNQFAMLPYIGDGSPVAQSFWVDDMVVATARP